MLKIFRSILGGSHKDTPEDSVQAADRAAPSELFFAETNQRFPFASHLKLHMGFPIADWDTIRSWVGSIETEALHGKAWTMAEHAWLQHLQAALGERYSLVHSDTAILLSPLEKKAASATLEYMNRTLQRVSKVLDGIAEVPPWGRDILIVFESEDQYYDYVSHYYPDSGEFAFSSGMFISAGCSHFVTVQSDLRTVEPVIAHEMTHACLSHLPIPLWLNEGLAVNTEQRLAGKPSSHYSAREMREQHLAFWGTNEIQEFWSGKSFSRTDDGNMLSYDLARILVEGLAKDWAAFRQFVLAARWQDAGAAAAQLHLGSTLGKCVSSLLEKSSSAEFEPAVDEIEKQQASAARANSLLETDASRRSA